MPGSPRRGVLGTLSTARRENPAGTNPARSRIITRQRGVRTARKPESSGSLAPDAPVAPGPQEALAVTGSSVSCSPGGGGGAITTDSF